MSLPTKAELLHGDLVDFTGNHKSVATNTLKIAEPLGKRHHDITRKVDSLVTKGLIDKRKLSLIYFVDSANRKQKAYELNEESALQVVMGLSGKKAEQLHKEIAQGFVRMKLELHDWRTGRLIASDSTKQANDKVYQLQAELAEEIPGSKRCTMIFIHFQRAITKSVTGTAKTERAMMTAHQLYQVEQLEQMVNNEIERLRFNGIAPQQIRDDVLTMIRTAKEKTPSSDQTERSLDNAIQ
tara:strand:- start:2318 stop:3037 length:720 start_codon:yes stop_codon:yes gene_type:complete